MRLRIEEGMVGGPPGPFVAWRHRDFRLLIAGKFVATIGQQMQSVAIAYQVYQLNHSALELGFLGLFRVLPVLLLSLVGGVLADAFDRRRLLLYTQPVLMICTVVLALLTWTGQISIGVIYALALATSAVEALDNPAQQAIIPALVPRVHLPNALSWNITLMEVATITGPAIGGLLLAGIGVAGTHGCEALAFLAPIVALLLMRARLGAATEEPGGWRAAVAGLRFVRANPIAMAVMGLDFGATFWGSATILLPVIADRVLHVGPAQLGFLFSAPAVGAVIGAGGMTLLGHRLRRPGWPLLLAVGVYGLATIGFGLSRSFPLAFLFLAGTGLTDTISMTLRHQILQLLTPNALRGRVTAANQVFVQGGPQLGQLEAGAVAARFGAPFSVVSGGVACLLTVALIALAVPAIRRYDLANEATEVRAD